MTKPLLFLRSLAFYLGFIPVTFVLTIIYMVVIAPTPPRVRHRYVSCWIDLTLWWLRVCCGVRHEIRGLEHLPDPAAKTPVVLLANHQSAWETLLIYRLMYPVAPILKRELFLIPFFGQALWLARPIAINRGTPHQASRDLLKQGTARLKQGYSLFIFPEGTRAPVGQMKHFSRGGARLAVAAQVPIVPLAHNAGHCWPRASFIKRPGLISVRIAPPIPTTDQDPTALTRQVEAWIRDAVAGMAQKSAS